MIYRVTIVTEELLDKDDIYQGETKSIKIGEYQSWEESEKVVEEIIKERTNYRKR